MTPNNPMTEGEALAVDSMTSTWMGAVCAAAADAMEANGIGDRAGQLRMVAAALTAHTAALREQAGTLVKHQPCGCVICTCEDEVQCQGCGAKHCGNRTDHPPYVKQQPEARGVVDAEAIASSLVDWMLTKAMPNGDLLHASVACDYAGMANFKRAVSKQLRAALTAAQQPVQEGGGEDDEYGERCESALPTCGPAVAWDEDGIGACERCAKELGWIAMLCEGDKWLDTGCNKLDMFPPTHWRPLPDAPLDAAGSAEGVEGV